MTKLVISLFTILFSLHVSAVTVIVHPSNGDAIDMKTIERIFLGKVKKFPGGGNAVPINLPEGSEGSEAFNAAILNRSASQVKAYWSKLVFTGKGQPPREVGSEAEVIDLISKNPDMIGYIQGDASAGVKAVGSF